MCTVTFLPRAKGYLLGMNRDENRARIAALPPRIQVLGERYVVYPSEPAGGTWISVNDAGVTLALVNWYAIQERVTGAAISRGTIIQSAAAVTSPLVLEAIMQGLPLARMNPFRLIGFFLEERRIVEWRWDCRALVQRTHRWLPQQWISSGFDEPGAQKTRSRVFRQARAQSSFGTRAWLRRLHASHTPEPGAYSTCVHRHDARSVSYTEVLVRNARQEITYRDGSPCETKQSTTITLRKVETK